MDSFHLFPTLPEEIRGLIWEHSFTPRVIPLSCADVNGGRHIQLKLTPPRRATVLQICHESRAVAKRRGYVPWAITNDYCKMNLMWNPNIDIVYIYGADAWKLSLRHMCRLDSLTALLWQRVALQTSYFREAHVRRAQILGWLEGAVRELTIVYDGEYEEECRRTARQKFEVEKRTVFPWAIPFHIDSTMRTAKHEGALPEVRVVKHDSSIIDGQSVDLYLRCC